LPRSMLNLYVEIAKALIDKGPLSISELALVLNVDQSSLKERLNFLISNDMIGKKNDKTILTYNIKKRGKSILGFFKIQPLIKITTDKN
jgi:predicted transcriptional regulator